MEKSNILIPVVIIAVVAALCCLACVPANNDNCYSYTANPDGTATVTGFTDYNNSVCKIPDYAGGMTVTAIADDAFCNDKNITSIEIPGSVKTIGDNAFKGCSNVTSIKIDGKDVGCLFYSELYGHDDLYLGTDCFKDTGMMNVTFERKVSNDTIVKMTFTNVPSSIKTIHVDTSLNDTTDVISKNTVDVNKSDFTADIIFGTYGHFENIKVTAYGDDSKELWSTVYGGVDVTAKHYNFALLNATYPVLLYTLDLCHDSGEGDTLSTDPTFMYLERWQAYDWSKLPSNVQPLPFLEKDATFKGELGFHNARVEMAKYIGELHELNSESTFTLYCVDNYPELILELLVGNQIPESNWDAHLLTDGSGTAYLLCKAFGVDDPYEVYDEMVEDWNAMKEKVWKDGYTTETVYDLARHKESESIYSMLNLYAYPISKEQANVDWTTGRLRAAENLSAIDPAFAAGIMAEAKQVYTNNLLAQLTESEAVKFKELYHFSDEMFQKARESGKEIMIILGTSGAGEGIIDTEGSKSLFYAYVKMTMDFFGDDYVYYYKGHPGYPTSLYPHRQEALDALRAEGYEIYELDNSVAAEVIMFYNPDAYLSGWKTSTFSSVSDATRACALFDSGKGVGIEDYLPMIDLFFTQLSGTSYHNIVLEEGKKYFLVEYNNTPEYAWQVEEYNKHEIAIYNLTDDELKYYKLDPSTGDYTETTA